MLNIDLKPTFAAIHELNVETLVEIDAGQFGDFGRENRAIVEAEARLAWAQFMGEADA